MKNLLLVILLLLSFSSFAQVTITSTLTNPESGPGNNFDSPIEICRNETLVFGVHYTGANQYYVYYVAYADGERIYHSGLKNPNSDFYTFDFLADGTYTDLRIMFKVSSQADHTDEASVVWVYNVKDKPTNVNAGDDDNICLNTYELNASEPSDGIGTWSANGITFSDDHANNATAYNIPDGVSVLTWTVENSCGVASDNVTITKSNKPIITQQPQSQTIKKGGYAIFSVTANDTNSYQWQKNEQNIQGANSSTYQIESTQTSDAGTYTCTVSNDCGTIVSNPAVLTVNASTSIADNPNINIAIYPNPTNGKISIKTDEEIVVKIYSISGIKVYQQKINKDNNIINLSNLSNGIYLLNTNYKNLVINKQIVINH